MHFLTDRIINGMRTHLLQCSTDKNDCRSCWNVQGHSCGTRALWWSNIKICIDELIEITTSELFFLCLHMLLHCFVF